MPSKTSQVSTMRPRILLLSLQAGDLTQLANEISAHAALEVASDIEATIQLLSENPPSAIVITDPATAQPKSAYDAIRLKLVDYVKGGGTVVMAAFWSSFVTPLDADRWFEATWGLPWRFGDYHRTTVHLHKQSVGGRIRSEELVDAYSQKAVFLTNVAKEDGLYWPTAESLTQSMVFSATPVDQEQSPVVFKKFGAGCLGYIGDVNDETASRKALLAMCGL